MTGVNSESIRWHHHLKLAQMLILLVILFPLSAPVSAQTSATAASDRFVLCSTYCGLVNGTGQRVTDRVFEQLDDFNGAAAVYRRKQKYGAIDRSGHRIVKPEHDYLWSPADGFLVAEDRSATTASGGEGGTIYTLFDAQGTQLLQLKGNVLFQGWKGHVLYQIRCQGEQKCPTTVLDPRGNQVAEFAYFNGQDDQLAVASLDGRSYGFLDDTLRFVIPPQFNGAELFKRNAAIVQTTAGPGLIDRRGRALVKPGRYSKLYIWQDTSLMTAFRLDQPDCPVYLRQDGKPIRLPRGMCVAATDYFDALGYAFIRDSKDRLGIIDARGQVLIRPSYPWLRALNDRYLIFGNEASRPTQFGVLDRHGKVVLAPLPVKLIDYASRCCSGSGALQNAVIGVLPDGGTGLLGFNGNWIIPPHYKAASVISSDLLAMRNSDDQFEFFTGAGERVPLKSESEPTPTSTRIGPAATAFFFWQPVEKAGANTSYKGMADAQGKILIPARYSRIEDVGEDILALTSGSGPERIGFADRTGKIIVEPQFTDLVSHFRDGAAVVRNRQGDTVLIGHDGGAIASFANLYPDVANSGGGFDRVELALDICIDPDPTAEPEERPSTKPDARKICGHPALRALSREIETAWRHAQTGDCLPDTFIALRPGYERALGDCTNEACLKTAMDNFRRRISETKRQCAGGAEPTPTARSIPALLRARLTKRVIAEAASNDDEIQSDAGKPSITLESIWLGHREAILATAQTGAHNGPIWLFLQDGRGAWSEIFTGYAGYLRPLEATTATRNGLPILRTQQHVSCCEHAVDFFAYDGSEYKPIQSCTQLYESDEMPLLFCEPRRDTEGGQ